MRFLVRHLAMCALLGLLLASSVMPANAESADVAFNLAMRDRALNDYGWRPEAIAYITRHTRLISTPGGDGSPCPTAVACTLPNGSVYLNASVTGRSLEYVLNHEYIHAMEFARGSAEGNVGRILADVLVLSTDPDYPDAAYAARRVLDLTVGDGHGVIASHDWFHIEHDILEDVGWDVGNLPGWFSDQYFPYLQPAPQAGRAVSPARRPLVPDADVRTQSVLDTIVSLCGPILPGARLTATMVPCAPATEWADAPYGPMLGGAAPAPTTSAQARPIGPS
ncbi:MAG: hypothetical protein NVSMB2_15200 [Chloroflexota bacterium]